MRRSVVFSVFLLGLVACDDMFGPAVDAPTNLTYELEPSGDPLEPSGAEVYGLSDHARWIAPFRLVLTSQSGASRRSRSSMSTTLLGRLSTSSKSTATT